MPKFGGVPPRGGAPRMGGRRIGQPAPAPMDRGRGPRDDMDLMPFPVWSGDDFTKKKKRHKHRGVGRRARPRGGD